jgi:hypothetical protein
VVKGIQNAVKKQEEELEKAIRDPVLLPVERATLDGYHQGYKNGKRRAVN